MGSRRVRLLKVALSALLATTLAGANELPEPSVVCLHVPITGAAPIPHHPDRFGQFYFDYVNAELGGIDGRPVRFLAFNDEYRPDGARRAVEKCVDAGAALLLGYVGIDQIVSASKWAEQRGIPYLHGSAPERETGDMAWSAAIGPSDEMQMRAIAASILATADPPEVPRVGIVRMNSPYFDAGRDAFAGTMAEAGIDILVDVAVQKDESSFSNIWYQLQTANVRIVNLFVTPHIIIKMMNQKPATYAPTFMAPSNLAGTNLVAARVGNLTMHAFHEPSPVYDHSDQTLPWYEEMEEFRRIFQTYSPEQNLMDDIDWMSYVRAKQVHRFLDALDGDLSPEHIRSMFSTYSETPEDAFPGCALDFSATPGRGAHSWHVFRSSNTGTWSQEAFCNRGEPIDRSPPKITCPATPVALGRVTCSLMDTGSGIGIYTITDGGVPRMEPVSGDGACAPIEEVVLEPGTGVHLLGIEAFSCSGMRSTAQHTFIGIGA